MGHPSGRVRSGGRAPTAARAGVLVLSLLSPLLGLSCGRAQAPSAHEAGKPEPREVVLVEVVTHPAARHEMITGTIFGEEEVSVAAEVGGRLVAIVHDLGDEVAPGGVLAQIDPTNDELAVARAEAELLATLARVGLNELPNGEPDLSNLPLVMRAEAQEANARARLERARQLHERTPPLISEQEFNDLQTQHEVAATSVGSERLAARALLAEARVRAASLDAARKRLDDTSVRAPREMDVTFRVASRRVSVGEVVSSGQALFRLVASDRVKFRGYVPDRFAGIIGVGSPAELLVDGVAEPFAASVSRVSPAVEIASRSFEIEILAPNRDHRLKPGSFVRARVRTGVEERARFVPASAVLQFAGVQRVFSIREGRVTEHVVTLSEGHAPGWYEVRGLPEVVGSIIDQPRGLTQGTEVRAERAGGDR